MSTQEPRAQRLEQAILRALDHVFNETSREIINGTLEARRILARALSEPRTNSHPAKKQD